MRISDLSSDVCSSNLLNARGSEIGTARTIETVEPAIIPATFVAACKVVFNGDAWTPGGLELISDLRVDEIGGHRSEEHTSELQSLMRISYAVFCLKKKKKRDKHTYNYTKQSTI